MTDHASPGLLRVLERLDTPAQIVSDLGVTLSQNALAEALDGTGPFPAVLAAPARSEWHLGKSEVEGLAGEPLDGIPARVRPAAGDHGCSATLPVGLSALPADPRVDGSKLGAVGHSYGDYVTILLAAFDERVRFACASGSACSYKRRMLDRTGIELSQAIPGILELADAG